jgi:HSP20 family protein
MYMSLIKWNPEVRLSPSLSSWMDDFFSDNNGDWNLPMVRGVSIPAVNVTEGKDSYNMALAAPGFKKEDFKVELSNGCLTVSGESEHQEEEKDEKVTRKEFSYASFNRSFTLPENVKSDNISAKYTDGILHIAIPKSKTEEKQGKVVMIK